MKSRKKKKEIKLPREFKKYFWDVDFDKLSFSEYYNFIVSRILSFGSLNDYLWLVNNSSEESIKNTLETKEAKQLDKRSRGFWRNYFSLKPLNIENKLWPY